MVPSRASHKVEKVTITLLHTSDESSFRHVPSTFSATNRSYAWKHFEQIDYMIVPRKVSSSEIKVDLFVETPGKGKTQTLSVQKAVQSFVKSKIESEWKGLKLGGIGRPTAGEAPGQKFKRGTIEEILGVSL